MKLSVLIYLHGMNSSPGSSKAQSVAGYIKENYVGMHCIIPKQSNWPKKNADTLLEEVRSIAQKHTVYLMGSSLGGYFATWLREMLLKQFPGPAIKMALINPVAYPYHLFQDYLGPQTNYYTSETYELTMEHVLQIEALKVDKISSPLDVMVLLQSGDEVLDYRQAVKRYKECVVDIEEGGNHTYQGFDHMLPRIFDFFSVRPDV